MSMQFPNLNVEDQVSFVTGAGSGLDNVFAIGLIHFRADVAITELPGKENLAQETLREIQAQGRQGFAVPHDVTKFPMIGTAIDSVLERFGRIDLRVSNAGINIPKHADDVTEENGDPHPSSFVRGYHIECPRNA